MNYKAILEDIKKNSLKSVYLFYGTEKYLIDWVIKQIKDKYIDETFETLNYIFLNGKEIKTDNVINACETLPFMSDKKVVIVDNPLYFSSSDENKNEEELLNYLKNKNLNTILIFILDNEKIDNRKKIIKTIKDNGEIIEFNKLSFDELVKWIKKKFTEYKKKITNNEINYIIQLSAYLEKNNNKTLYDLENEIVKIVNFLGNNSNISKEDIEKVMIKSIENNIFKLVDGIGQKKPELSIKILNEMLLENEPIQVIMHMVIRQFRLLYKAKLLDEIGYSQIEIAKKIKVQPYIAKKILNQCRNFSRDELDLILKKCLEIDKDIKKGKIDSKIALETLIVNI